MFGNMMRFYGTGPAKIDYDDRYFTTHHPMMWLFGNNAGSFWLFGLLWLITWVAFIAVLFALARWLWKKGDKEK